MNWLNYFSKQINLFQRQPNLIIIISSLKYSFVSYFQSLDLPTLQKSYYIIAWSERFPI